MSLHYSQGLECLPAQLLPQSYTGNQWENRIASQLFFFFFFLSYLKDGFLPLFWSMTCSICLNSGSFHLLSYHMKTHRSSGQILETGQGSSWPFYKGENRTFICWATFSKLSASEQWGVEPQVSWCPGGRGGGGVNVFHCSACHQYVSGSGLAELKL